MFRLGVLVVLLMNCCTFFVSASPHLKNVQLSNQLLGKSFINQVEICEDRENTLTIDSLLAKHKKTEFKTLSDKISSIDFTTSAYWIKFSVTNQSDFTEFILETARPITNKVIYYEVLNNEVVQTQKNGDDFNFKDKKLKHRKILFPLHLNQSESKDIYIYLKSDGEVITLPLIISNTDLFYLKDARLQFVNGMYYGILLLIVIIYFFFYLFLKDKSFLYYIVYVLSLIFLQFSLDGYTYQRIFNAGGYFTNHSVLFFAALTIILLLQYAQSYLNLTKNNIKFYKSFRFLQIGMGVLGLTSLIPGKPYELMYPAINGLSLISIITIVYSIYYLKVKGVNICNFFTSAFTILILGAVVFILGNFNVIIDPVVSLNSLKFSSGLEAVILSISMARKYRELQQSKEEVQQMALESLQEKNRLMDDMNTELEKQVESRTTELRVQKNMLEGINEEILSSIKYAQRIQQAILPSEAKVKRILPDSFVFYLPKDVVSGDFYFVEQTTSTNENRKLSLFAAVDCTGHGVPGAFMSLVGHSFLKQSLTEESVNSSGECLDFLNQGVCNTLSQEANQAIIRDGMDIAFGAIDFDDKLLYFSGAKNPIFIIRNEKLPEVEETKRNPVYDEKSGLYLNEIKGDKHPIGNYIHDELIPFSTHIVKLKKGDSLYVFSDGFVDQFGGKNGKKYNSKRFKQLLLQISQLPMNEQNEIIQNEFNNWKGELEQVDDVCVIGIRV